MHVMTTILGYLFEKVRKYRYEIILFIIIIFHFSAIFHTNAYLTGADISDYVDMKSASAQPAAFKSANLPVFYLFSFLYKTLGIPNDYIKAIIAFFCLTVIVWSIYKITITVFENKLAGLLSVVLFLYTGLFFGIHYSTVWIIDNSNPDALSFSFLMLGILYWLNDRYRLSSLFLGLSFGCHPILPLAFIILFFLYMLLDIRRKPVKELAVSVALFIMVTFPVTLSMLKVVFFTIHGSVKQALDADLIWRYVRFLQPQTVFIDTIPMFHIGIALFFSTILLLVIFINTSEPARKRKFIKILSLLVTILLFVFFEILNSYYFKIIAVYNLWFFRYLTYGSTMCYIVLAGAAFYRIKDGWFYSSISICLLFILFFSVMAGDIRAGRAAALYYCHYYLFEIAFICFLYFIYQCITQKDAPAIMWTVNIALILAAFMYLFYLSVFNPFSPERNLLTFFQLKNMLLFIDKLFYKQIKDIITCEYFRGIIIVLPAASAYAIITAIGLWVSKKRSARDAKIQAYLLVLIMAIILVTSTVIMSRELISFQGLFQKDQSGALKQ